MRMDIHHYIHFTDPTVERKLDHLIHAFETFRSEIMAIEDDLIAAVTDETTVEQSVITLLGQISAQLAAAGTDKAKIQAAIDTINSNKAALAAAVTANTPAA